MSTLEVQVRKDGTVVIPASDVASLGVKPGQTLAVELHRKPTPHKPSRGILKGVLPSITFDELRADRAERLTTFANRRGL